MRIASEGWTFIGAAAAVTLLAWLAGLGLLALLALIVTVFFASFFRDPDRLTPAGTNLITSPADGKVVAVVDDVNEERFLKRACRRVSIFMSPLDVHVNRVPVDGRVVEVVHQPGQFHAAFLDKASELNEQTAVLIEDGRGERVLCVQIAGQLVRRIVCRLRPGDAVRRGDRYGLIMFGSRLDLYVPPKVEVRVKVGDRVAAGVSVIGCYK